MSLLWCNVTSDSIVPCEIFCSSLFQLELMYIKWTYSVCKSYLYLHEKCENVQPILPYKQLALAFWLAVLSWILFIDRSMVCLTTDLYAFLLSELFILTMSTRLNPSSFMTSWPILVPIFSDWWNWNRRKNRQ